MEEELAIYQNAISVKTACESYVICITRFSPSTILISPSWFLFHLARILYPMGVMFDCNLWLTFWSIHYNVVNYYFSHHLVFFILRIITHIVAQPEAFSTTPRAEANPWHIAAGGGGGLLGMFFGKHWLKIYYFLDMSCLLVYYSELNCGIYE